MLFSLMYINLSIKMLPLIIKFIDNSDHNFSIKIILPEYVSF